MSDLIVAAVGIPLALSPLILALAVRHFRRRVARAWLAAARMERARKLTDEQMGHEPLVRIAEGIVALAYRRSGQHNP